jgi:hypothetical protein
MTETTPTSINETAPNPPVRNAAVLRSCAARDLSLAESRAKRRKASATKSLAEHAFRIAMPDLYGYENIRDYIACIAHGLVSGDVHPIESSTFFYAAQVATAALRREPKDPPSAQSRHQAAAEIYPSPYPVVTNALENPNHSAH